MESKSGGIASLIILASLFLIYMISTGMMRHDSFNSKAWDMAIFAQLIDNFRHGVFFEANVRGVSNIFSDHFTPIIYLFSPFLFVWNNPSGLLVAVQAVFIVAGAFPVYFIAKKRTGSESASLMLSLLYLFLPTLQYISIFDFHAVVLSIPLILFAWYFKELKKYPFFYLFLFLAMLCHEQIWIVVGMIGVYEAIFERERVRGIILALVGWIGFFVLVLLFFPAFRESGDYFYVHRYAYLGNSVGEIILNFFIKPALWIPRLFNARTLMFVVLMLIPVGFLPVFRPKHLFILIPTFFYSVLSIEGLQSTMFAQYAAPYVPFIIISSIYGFSSLQRRCTGKSVSFLSPSALCIFAIVAVLLSNLCFSPFVHSRAYQKNLFAESDLHSEYLNAISMIPEDASVSAGSKFAPHLVRRYLYLTPSVADADYVILDLSDYHYENFEKDFRSRLLRGFEIIYEKKSLMVLKRNEHFNLNDQDALRLTPDLTWVTIETDRRYIFTPVDLKLDQMTTKTTLENFIITETKKEKPFVAAYFIKEGETVGDHFGVMVYPDTESPTMYSDKPEFTIFRLWSDDYSPLLKLEEGRYQKLWNCPESYIEQLDKSGEDTPAPLIMFLPMPENYPNTLEEYFTEMYIQGMLGKEIYKQDSIQLESQRFFSEVFEIVSDVQNLN